MLYDIFITRFGAVAFGYYTLGFELSVEATFPIDQTLGSAMIFVSGHIQGFILVMISGALEKPLSKDKIQYQVGIWSMVDHS